MSKLIDHRRFARVVCATCATVFFVERNFDDRRRKDEDTFYCPTGHANVYHNLDKRKQAEAEAAEKAKSQERLVDTQRRRIEYLEGIALPLPGICRRAWRYLFGKGKP